MAPPVDIRLWLSTFHNQRNLAHQASVLLSGTLLAAGFITFIYQGFTDFGNFDDFDGSRRRTTLAWSSGVVGMVASCVNIALWRRLSKAERHDPLATDEQMSVRRINTTVIGCIGLVAVALGEGVLLAATASSGFVGIPICVALAGSMTVVTIGYDIAYLVRPNRIVLDEAVTVPLTYDEFDP